jgi:uncharacterized membrane protein
MVHEQTTQSWRLAPHRSLSRAGRIALLAGTAAVGGIMAVGALGAGLWPLAIFAAIPPLGVAFALAANDRSAREWQDVTLDGQYLTVTHHRPSWRTPRVTQIPPYMLKVETVMDPVAAADDIERCNRILLKARGKTWEVGAFLPPDEKLAFARALRDALRRWAAPRPGGPAP